MHFDHAHILHLLWLALPLAWLLHLAHSRREKLTDRFIRLDLLPGSQREFSLRRWRLKAVLLLIFFVSTVLAMARPQWGYEWQEARMEVLDILIAVDVSKSMLTQDVRPNRLERTKLAIQEMVKQLKGDRMGLIAFAGQAFLTCPLTNDYNGFLMALNDLSVNTIPRGGTDLAAAINEAIKVFGGEARPHKTLIFVTDGEEQEGDALAAARRAKAEGIKIYTVGIGTQEGDLMRVSNEQGQTDFLKDTEGNYVKSRLNEPFLQQIAYLTQGAYVRSSGAQFGLDYLYERQLSKLEKHSVQNKMEKRYHDRFHWFLAIALAVLIAESVLTPWRTQ